MPTRAVVALARCSVLLQKMRETQVARLTSCPYRHCVWMLRHLAFTCERY